MHAVEGSGGDEDEGASAIVERGGIGGSDGAGAGDESWLDGAEFGFIELGK
jgi:hypothetical protein